ncbi:MAG: HPr-rel-A system PqqD family peptide chaperone [Methylococcales bacterium]|nr:HPr-rel-A system PqqD family peptide chaperone [Methylococcales bacterium]
MLKLSFSVLSADLIAFPKGGIVSCRFWENDCVVYQELFGQTHLIEGIGAQVFKLVSEAAITYDDLLANLQSNFELENNADMGLILDNLILEYQKLGLLAVTDNDSA